MKGGVIIMQNESVSNLVFLEQLTFFNYEGCSAGDGCNCDGDVDECIGNGAD